MTASRSGWNGLVLAGALAILSACGGKSPAPAQQQPAPANPPAGTPAASPAPSAPPAATPAPQTTPPQPAQPQPAPPPPVSHGPDDRPIVISDGSLWIALDPLGAKGEYRKQMSFSNFDRQPGDTNEIREIGLVGLGDNTSLKWDGIDINGTAPQTCQNPAEDCLVQIQYEGPGMDLEVAWNANVHSYGAGRRLVFRFPGRPVNQWIDWVRDSHIIFHPLDWDHSARKKITQLYLNRNAQTVDPNGNRITIHLKPEPR